MYIEFSRPTIYMSHPIRGSDGNISRNCHKAKKAAARLRKAFPDIDIYCPAESDLTLQILTEADRLDIDDIMYADLQILQACHGYLWYDHQLSSGCVEEYEAAKSLGLIPPDRVRVAFPYDLEKVSFTKLRQDISPLVSFAINKFREKRRNNEKIIATQ